MLFPFSSAKVDGVSIVCHVLKITKIGMFSKLNYQLIDFASSNIKIIKLWLNI